MRYLTALIVVGLLSWGLPAGAQTTSQVLYEKYSVPTVGGETINVEVVRDRRFRNAPVILTYTPYSILRGEQPAQDGYADRYVPQGYARAMADVIGTRDSSGCFDYGGPKEQQSGVDVVKFLAGRPWSNGKVAMIGGSYDGTTANMVAARGADVPELKGIVPIAAISRWYGYAYSSGVRYFLNSERPTDEGFDTPFAFDFGFGRVPPMDYTQPGAADALIDRTRVCSALQHTDRGYFNPNYDAFWLARDFRKDAAGFRAAVLVAHGWQDYNVKQEEGLALYKQLPVDKPGTVAVEGVPFKRLHMYQDGHGSPSDDRFPLLLDRFLAHTLKGAANGIDRQAPVLTEGRRAPDAATGFRVETAWPPPGTKPVSLFLDRGAGGGTLGPASAGASASYTDLSTTTEEGAKQAPQAEASWLYYISPPLARDVRMADAAALDVQLQVNREGAHLTPVLVDVAPDGTLSTVSRGFGNLQYRNTLRRPEPLPVNQPIAARVLFKPQDQQFEAGHRIGVILASSNTVWAVPDEPGAVVTVLHGPGRLSGLQSRLQLPIVNPPADPGALFAP